MEHGVPRPGAGGGLQHFGLGQSAGGGVDVVDAELVLAEVRDEDAGAARVDEGGVRVRHALVRQIDLAAAAPPRIKIGGGARAPGS